MFQCSIRVAFLGALVLCAGWGLGQTANVYDLPVTDQLTVNTCSMGEPVTLNGTIHFSYSVTTDSTGVNHFAITAANQLLPAITEALASTEPIFIDVPTKSELEEVPPVHAWQEAVRQERTFVREGSRHP